MTPDTLGPAQAEDGLIVSENLLIPLAELTFRYSRSGGPGGQHVNRTETRVELLFDVGHSPSLSETQRSRILTRLAHRIDQAEVLHVISSVTRSQSANREDALTRLRSLLQHALQRRKSRIPTRPGTAARERRLTQKRHRADRKKTRGRVRPGDD